ncbi:MAG: hypothetical protein ABSB86_00735 [Bryobacteraceae bacterium]
MEASFSQSLASITLPDSNGASVRLGGLWESSAAVIVFLRHYG